MRIGSLFSGAGLLDAGLHQAGHEHAWFVERDEWRREQLARRWPGRPVHDDVRTVGAHNLEPVECIAGGFPCKGASTAGKRTGLAHPETALWAEFARIVGELRPWYVVLENVANILALHDGAVWGTVLGDLAALGFDVAWDCVPAAAFGAPHGRDRVFAIAHIEGGNEWAKSCPTGQSRATRRSAPSADARPRSTSRVKGPARSAEPRFADAPADTPIVRPERGRRARAGRDGLADRGQVAADADQRTRAAEHGHEAAVRQAEPERPGVDVAWGDYEPAIRRWEAVHGPPPEPLVRRLDDGDPKLQRVRARVDRQRLSALGDGVHVYLGRLIGDALNDIERGGREALADA